MNNEKIKVIKGDITKVHVDGIVNAANSSLLGGGGVDGAIHMCGGKEILKECMKIRKTYGKCSAGQAVITTGGKLPCKYVIHTVGPIWVGGNNDENELLARSYRNSLKLALKNKIETIAFPNISTGVYGFPKESAAKIVLSEVNKFLYCENQIKKVIFVCFDEENYKIYKRSMFY